MNNSMKSLVLVVCILSAAASSAREAAAPVSDKAAAEAVIKGLYAKKISEYESPLGRPAKAKVCAYMKSIFDSSLFEPDPTNLKCIEFRRFPNIHEEALSLIDDAGELPKTQIVESRLNGNEAVVKVKTSMISGYGTTSTRVVYFLRKTDSGWKIFNMLSYENRWPLDMNSVEGPEVHGCQGVGSRYSFLTYPRGPEDLEDLPKVCRDYEIKERNRTKEWDR